MKIGLVAVVGVLLGASSIACGPGLSHQGNWAKAPAVVTDQPSTTTLTSAAAPVTPKALPSSLPSSRVPVAQWDEDEPGQPVVQTWGAPPEIDPEYGF